VVVVLSANERDEVLDASSYYAGTATTGPVAELRDALRQRQGADGAVSGAVGVAALLRALVGYLDDRHQHEDGCWDGCRERELLDLVPAELISEARRTTRREAIAALAAMPAESTK
jgi:hypothetical protein